MPLNLDAASNALKNYYLPVMQKLLNNSTVLLSMIERDSTTQDVYGKNFTVAIHKGRNLSAGRGTSDGGALPTAGEQSYANAIVPNKYTYATIQVTGPTIRATRDNAGAFVRAVESEIQGVMVDMKRAINRQFHGDGKDALAYWTTSDNTLPAVDVDDNQGTSFTHLPVGQTVVCDLVNSATHAGLRNTGVLNVTVGAENATGTSTAIAVTGGSVASTADGDYLILNGTLGHQKMGLQGIISEIDPVVPPGGGTLTGLHGLAVGTETWWKSQIVGSEAAKRDLSFADIQRLFSRIGKNSSYSEADIKALLCSYETRDKYVELATNERQWFNTLTLDGGFKAVDHNGVPLVPDNQCRRGTIYAIVPDALRIFQTSDFEWMEEDGAVLSRVSGVDAYGATLFHYGDLACVNRPALGKLVGIND
jgi:hypothetical protein